jgi:glycosyltransferase involved in cell wall biosynthesis
LVIEPGNSEELADAIERLVHEPTLRAGFGDAARTLSARFDVSRATRQLESIYRDITKTRTPGPEAR